MKKVLSEFHLTPAQMKAINDEGKKKLKELKKKAKETKATDKPKKVKKEPKSREIPVPKKRGRPKKVVEPTPKKRGRPIKVDLTALKKSNSAVKKKLMSDMKKRLLREEATKKTDRKAEIAKVAKNASEDDTLQSLSDRLKNVVVKPSEAEFEAPKPSEPKKRGRPLGSKNKPKTQLNEAVNDLHLNAHIDPEDLAHYERIRNAQEGFVIPHIDRSESRPRASVSRSRGQAEAEEALALMAKAMKPKEIATQTAKPSLAPYPKPRSRKSTPSTTPVASPIHEPNYSEGKSESADEQLARLVSESIANDKKVTVKDVEREAKKQGLQVKGERKIKIRKIAQALKNAAPKVTISHAGVKGAEAAEVSDTRANGKLYNWAAKIRYPKEDIEKVQEGKPLIVTDKEGKEHHADFLIEGVSVFIPRDSRLSEFGDVLHFNSFIEKLHEYMKTHTGAFGFVGGNADQFDALKNVLPIEKLEAKNRRSPAPKKKFVSAEPKESKEETHTKEEKPKSKGKKAPPPPPREPPPESASVLSPISESKPSYRFRDNYTHGSDIESDEELSDSDNEGRGFGSLTEHLNHYKNKGIKSLDEFANHILSNPNEFDSRTHKRAKFYTKIRGKGIESDSDSDSDSNSDSDSDSEGKISTHNIMPIVRPHCFHPATESSTMTMNPGAFNNIKPLLGHLMVGGGHPHTPVERTSNGMRTHSHYGPHAMGHHHAHDAMYVKHGAMRPHNHGGSIADLIHASAQHMTHTFGHPAPMALDVMNKAIREGIETLHPDLRPHATQALNGGHKLLAKTIGGAFFGDLGKSIKGGFKNIGHQIEDTAKDVGHQIENKASKVYNKDIVPALPGVVASMDQYYNSPATQGTMAGISSLLNSTGSPELGIPLSMANMALSNTLDAAADGRDPREQLEHRYVKPAKKAYKKGRKMLGLGAGKDLAKNLAENTGRLADSGSNYLIRQMDGHGVGKDLSKKLAEDTGRLADSGSNYLIRQMDGHGIKKRSRGGKVGQNLAKNLAENTGRLADSGSDYLIRQMDGHGCGGKVGRNLAKKLAHNVGRLADSGSDYLIKKMVGGEVGDGLYAQGRGFKKGSAEAKAHMAKIRAMRGKGFKKQQKEVLSDPNYGGAIPQPPSRSPVTRGGSFLA